MTMTAKHLAVALCLCLSATTASAVLMRPLSITELSQASDLVVRGTVLSKSCERDVDGRIFTRVQLRVSETWKGILPAHSSGNRLTVVHGGGTMGRIRDEVSGQVEYSPGEDVLAFLVVNPRGEAVTVGLAQGKFHVWQDRKTGEQFARGLFLGSAESAGEPGVSGAVPKGNPPGLPVSRIKEQVQGN